MNNKEKQTLYIPLGLKTRTEIFDGFVKEEIFKSIILTLIAGAIDTIIYMLTKNTALSVVFFYLQLLDRDDVNKRLVQCFSCGTNDLYD